MSKIADLIPRTLFAASPLIGRHAKRQVTCSRRKRPSSWMKNQSMFPFRRNGPKKRGKGGGGGRRPQDNGGGGGGRRVPGSAAELLPMLQPSTKALAQMLAGNTKSSGQLAHARSVLAQANRMVEERLADRLPPAAREQFFEQLAILKLTIADAEEAGLAEETAAGDAGPAAGADGRRSPARGCPAIGDGAAGCRRYRWLPCAPIRPKISTRSSSSPATRRHGCGCRQGMDRRLPRRRPARVRAESGCGSSPCSARRNPTADLARSGSGDASPDSSPDAGRPKYHRCGVARLRPQRWATANWHLFAGANALSLAQHRWRWSGSYSA